MIRILTMSHSVEPVIEEVCEEERKPPCQAGVPRKVDQMKVLMDPNVGTDLQATEDYLVVGNVTPHY